MNRLRRWLVFTAPLLLALVLAAPEGLARPGGGHSYSGSSSSRGSSSSSSSHSYSSSGSSRSYSSSGSSYSGSGSSGSSNGSSFACFIFGLFIFVIVIASASNKKGPQQTADWSTVTPREESPFRPRPQVREGLERLRTVGPAGPDGRPVPFDPDFSLVLFEDFLYALYAKVHTARGGGQLETMAAYLSDKARQGLRVQGLPQRVEGIVVGAMHYQMVSPITPATERVSVVIRFEANYTEVSESGSSRSYYVAEDWTLGRSTKAKSRSPENTRVFKCPNCGAPLDGMQGNTCSYCQRAVNTGEFDWVVQDVRVMERESRGPQLGGDTPEEGTDLPTIKQPRVAERM